MPDLESFLAYFEMNLNLIWSASKKVGIGFSEKIF